MIGRGIFGKFWVVRRDILFATRAIFLLIVVEPILKDFLRFGRFAVNDFFFDGPVIQAFAWDGNEVCDGWAIIFAQIDPFVFDKEFEIYPDIVLHPVGL